jgi:predicted  nucleic acid-binding Zn-ribbon protein
LIPAQADKDLKMLKEYKTEEIQLQYEKEQLEKEVQELNKKITAKSSLIYKARANYNRLDVKVITYKHRISPK